MNKQTNILAEIIKLKNLQELDVSEKKLTELPDGIRELTQLVSLNLSKNELASLPPEIGALTELTNLDLSDNHLKSLPPEIRLLTKLKKLDLRNNQIAIPPEILSKVDDPQSILNYYFTVISEKKKPINEIKVIFVGQGSVGKTSLVRRITQNNFNVAEIKTEGITINRWEVECKSEVEKKPAHIQLNIWDFGGQEIMHATHQFFLTKRSLYLLVLDSRLTQEENRVEYWLKIIQSFGGASPVLVVGNKIDQHPLDIDRTGLQKKYPSIVGILETSAATNTGIEELKAAVVEQINKLPHVRDLLPETWFIVKTKLEDQRKKNNFINRDDYVKLCIDDGVSDETSQRTLIGFLHDLGVVLHFQDDPRLESLGILNPQWVTNGVYKILNSHSLFQNKGVLERAMLDQILDFPEYPASKRLFIVDMMRKFELCYDLEADKTFLVPDLLPKDEPYTGEWAGALAFQYHYNVLPSSIVSRFIVRMNGFIHKTVWRSGVVLQQSDNTALVKADTEDKKIYIWVNGAENTRRDFLSVIRAEFDAIHKTIIKIEASEKVPVPGNEKVVIDFQHLLKLERMGETTFIPEGLDQRVNVRELLNGVRSKDDVPRSPAPQTIPVETPIPEKIAPLPAKSAAESESLFRRVIHFIFVTIPRAIGHLFLDPFGKGKDAAPTTPILLGYIVIIVAVAIILGIVGTDALVAWFAGWWRFFNPVKL